MGANHLHSDEINRRNELKRSFFFGYIDLSPDEISPEQIARLLYEENWGSTIHIKRMGDVYVVYDDKTETTQLAVFHIDRSRKKFRLKYDYEIEVSGY